MTLSMRIYASFAFRRASFSVRGPVRRSDRSHRKHFHTASRASLSMKNGEDVTLPDGRVVRAEICPDERWMMSSRFFPKM